jgi:hypothetical protein
MGRILKQSTPSLVDYTHGFVNYRDRGNAETMGLAKIVNNAIYLGADSATQVAPGGTFGRSSVRVESNNQYRYGVFIYDIAHVPGRACGIWPAM